MNSPLFGVLRRVSAFTDKDLASLMPAMAGIQPKATQRRIYSLTWGFFVFLLLALTPIVCQAAPTASFSFDEGRGTTAQGTGGQGNIATLRNGATWVPGVHGTALGLNGTQSAELSHAVVNTSASFTVSAWVKVNALGGDQTFVSQDGQTVSAFSLGKSGENDHFAFTVSDADSATAPAHTAQSYFAPTPGL